MSTKNTIEIHIVYDEDTGMCTVNAPSNISGHDIVKVLKNAHVAAREQFEMSSKIKKPALPN